MRRVLFAFVACLLLACGGAAKPAAKVPAADQASVPTLRLKPDGPAVVFDLPKGWHASPQEGNPSLLVMTRGRFEAASVMLEEAAPGDEVEAVTLKWVQLSVSMLNFFAVKDLDPPTYPSDEEGAFVIRGVDDERRPMSLLLRVKLVPARSHDFWAVIMVTGPSGNLLELDTTAKGLAQSLRAEPASSRK